MARDRILRTRAAGREAIDGERWIAHRALHEASERSANKADEALAASLDAYKQSANEFRGSLDDQRRVFVTKAEHEIWGSRLTALENDKIARDTNLAAEARAEAEERERERAERSRAQWTIGLVIAILAILVSAVTSIVLHVLFP